MKAVLGFTLFLLLLLFGTGPVRGQTVDTVAYETGSYTLRKNSMTVDELADKLKVNPQLLIALNGYLNGREVIPPHSQVKVPVYPKGYVYEPEKVVFKAAPVDTPG
ncbi:MAG TPA: hypothetical protein VG603_13265, partial [Chitinophagales bacterium]|nr:hypothetical protein [Chitinophagales bacterium]